MKVCPSCGLKYSDDNDRCFIDKMELEDVPDPHIGKVLKGRYRIEEPLGEGGMAVVYRAQNTLVERPVAIKIMNANLASDVGLKERFRREAKNAASVAHPNIIDIHDHGETEDGTPFLVMEVLDGQPLDDIILQGPMAAEMVAVIGVQVAKGLARAHDFDVIHRDLKPENIFITYASDGSLSVPKLLDFGIARSMHDSRLTNAGEIFGTPQYMAPERVTSIDAGAPADLYALGVIFFEMVTGRLPFESDDLPGFFIKHLQDAPPRPRDLVPRIPAALEALILALLSKKPEERPVDAHAVVKLLEPLVPEGALPAPTSTARKASVRPPASAPTLPPTTLERWAGRTALFDEMLRRAYPQGNAPHEQARALGEIREILSRINDLRSAGLKYQRELEQMEAAVQETRERLGHAVHTLAEDLSKARETLRDAQREVAPYFSAEETARETYKGAHEKWLFLGGGRLLEEPNEPAVQAARDTAETLDRWVLSRNAAAQAHRWVESKEREVSDLEFQVSALRAQLDRVESENEDSRAANEEGLRINGEELASLEARLTELGSTFVEPLRPMRQLNDLFHRLQQQGTPAVGIVRP
ncbi:MAG: serine/threonine protein kinase [Sandaracinaceae bacterium]